MFSSSVAMKAIVEKDLIAFDDGSTKHCRKLSSVVSKEEGTRTPNHVFWFLRFDSLGWVVEEVELLSSHHGDKL